MRCVDVRIIVRRRTGWTVNVLLVAQCFLYIFSPVLRELLIREQIEITQNMPKID